jgi:hypothetical protein
MTTATFKKALRSELANAGLTKNKLHDVTDRGVHTVLIFTEPIDTTLLTWLSNRFSNGVWINSDYAVYLKTPKEKNNTLNFLRKAVKAMDGCDGLVYRHSWGSGFQDLIFDNVKQVNVFIRSLRDTVNELDGVEAQDLLN